MNTEGTPMLIGATEAERNFIRRLETYRLAVANGFYNEWPQTAIYRGFQIVPEAGKFAVVQHGAVLIKVQTQHIAKCWIACRTENMGLADANKLVQAEDGTTFCKDCASIVAQPHDCHD